MSNSEENTSSEDLPTSVETKAVFSPLSSYLHLELFLSKQKLIFIKENKIFQQSINFDEKSNHFCSIEIEITTFSETIKGLRNAIFLVADMKP